MFRYMFSLFLCCLGNLLLDAQPASPAPVQTGPILITGAKAHLGNGEVIENSIIAFDNGKLTTGCSAKLAADLTLFYLQGK